MTPLAILLLSVVPAADRSSSADELNKAITELKNGETKLKSTYQEAIQGYKNITPIMKQISDAAHDIEVLNTEMVAIAGSGKNYNGRRAEANARGALQSRIRDLEKKKSKLEADLKSKRGPVDALEEAFKDEEKKSWEAANKVLNPVLTGLTIGDDKKVFEAVVSVFDLFVFDDHKDAPFMKFGSPLDQEILTVTGKCLATSGTKQIAGIKKLFDKSIAMKYAAVIAVTEIGPDAAKADKDVTSSLNELKAALIKNKTLAKSERDARLKLVDKAIDATRR
jgi:hypothetical protein